MILNKAEVQIPAKPTSPGTYYLSQNAIREILNAN